MKSQEGFHKEMKNHRGFTLIEVLFVVAIVSVAFLGIIRGFLGIGEGLLRSRNRTSALNIAQENIETLKKLSYPRVYVTTQDDLDAGAGYDNTYYPPETYIVENKEYTCYVRVRKVMESGTDLINLDPDDADEGLKRICVHVEWVKSGEVKTITLYSLKQNPDRAPLSGRITGTVRDKDIVDGGGPNPEITGATVEVIENPNWIAGTDTDGEFTIKVTSGSWTVRASQTGYFPAQASGSVGEGDTTDVGNIDLTPMGKRSIRGLVVSTSGVPVEGCIITCNDETSTQITSISTAGHPTWNFTLQSVSTGVWTVYATTGSLIYGDVSGSTEGITRTVDAQSPSPCQIILSTPSQTGSISGIVDKSDGIQEEGIRVTAGIAEDTCNNIGEYELSPVDEGINTITINTDDTNYTIELITVTVAAGQNTQAGTTLIHPCVSISGIIYTAGGVDPFPDMVVTAIDEDGEGIERGVGISVSDGTYEIMRLPLFSPGFTETYKIEPIVEIEDDPDPDCISFDFTYADVGEVFYATFTITSGWGYINGNVTDDSKPIKTGIIVLASTDEIDDPDKPPDMASGEDGIYGGISYSRGIYEIKLRTGSIYYVYAWYTNINSAWDGTATTSIGPVTANLSSGTTSIWIDFDW